MRFVLTFFALWLSLCAQAQISIEQYREVVLNQSFDIKRSAAASKRAYLQSRLERTEFFPKLSASGSFTTPFRRERDASLWGFEIEPRIVQPLYSGGGIRAAYRQSQAEYRQSQSEQEQVILEVINAADDAYWSLSAMQLYLAATDEYVKIIKSLYGVVKERYREGYVAKSDVLQVEARLSDAEYSRIAAKENYDIALHQFNSLRLEQDTLAVTLLSSIVDSLPMPHRVGYEDMLSRRPDVRVAQSAVEVAEWGVRLSRASYNPAVEVGVSGSWQTYKPNVGDKTYLDGALVVGVSVPIFHWGARGKAVAVAQQGVRQKQNQLLSLKEDISLEESNGWSALLSSYSQMQSSLRNVDIASENLRISTYSYHEGQATVLDVLQAQISWIQIYTNAISARYNYAQAWSAYNRITAK